MKYENSSEFAGAANGRGKIYAAVGERIAVRISGSSAIRNLRGLYSWLALVYDVSLHVNQVRAESEACERPSER